LHPCGVDFISGVRSYSRFHYGIGYPQRIEFSLGYFGWKFYSTGIEDVLEYFDETYDPATSPNVKLIYLENIKNPDKLLYHASSLVRKGCHIAAIKAGTSVAGRPCCSFAHRRFGQSRSGC
jgi:acetyltransferase